MHPAPGHTAQPQTGVFGLEGEWTVQNVPALEQEIVRWKHGHGGGHISADPARLDKLDMAGAWLIQKYFSGARFIAPFKPQQQALLDFIAEAGPQKPVRQEKPRRDIILVTGEKTISWLRFAYDVIAFVGLVFTNFGKSLLRPSRFRPAAVARHIEETGFHALPIICLLAFGISMVIFYQGATQLQKFGADIYTVDLTVISLLREMAVLTTAIMMAGRSGSAFAAEIGVMKLRGEVDALKTMGIDPIDALVLPRLLAFMLTLPLLSFVADIVGLFGGGLMSRFMLGISFSQYIDRVQHTATPAMFFIGMVKTPVMAFLITAICTYQGMSVSGSAENVGKVTTLAVVQSIFLVIMVDALFSVVFSWVGL